MKEVESYILVKTRGRCPGSSPAISLVHRAYPRGIHNEQVHPELPTLYLHVRTCFIHNTRITRICLQFWENGIVLEQTTDILANLHISILVRVH